jgi:hypothetical protein
VIAGIDPSLTFHDFRVVKGQTHSNLIFDVMIPFSYKMDKPELIAAIQDGLKMHDPKLWAVINIDYILA